MGCHSVTQGAPAAPGGENLLRSVLYKRNQGRELEPCYDSNKSVSCFVSTLEELV